MGDVDYPIEWMNFSAGESFFKTSHIPKNIRIVWNYDNDAEFFKLGQLIDYFENNSGNFVNLFIPYFPHSRQDRYSGKGQPFSLKVALKFLDSIRPRDERKNFVYNEKVFIRISTLDLHSDVALKDTNLNIINIDSSIFAKEEVFKKADYDFVVSPDKGAKQRAQQICERLEAKGFASTNVVLGIGSYTYNYNTRDSLGIAVKSTYCEVVGDKSTGNVECREIFKDPVTDDGVKKSARGLLRVDSVNGELVLKDRCTPNEEAGGLLEVVFENGKLVKDQTLAEIRGRLWK